jgi:hypothetical protein
MLAALPRLHDRRNVEEGRRPQSPLLETATSLGTLGRRTSPRRFS